MAINKLPAMYAPAQLIFFLQLSTSINTKKHPNSEAKCVARHSAGSVESMDSCKKADAPTGRKASHSMGV